MKKSPLNYRRYRAIKAINLSIITLIVLSLMLSSCTVESIINNVWQNMDYVGQSLVHPFTVSDAKGTYLLKSRRIFYPDGIPEDPAALPDLNSKNLSQIEKMLSDTLNRVNKTQKRHKKLLGMNFSRFDLKLARPRLKILNQGNSVVAVEGSGRIFVDAKVIQAVYRSALISVLIADQDREQDLTKEQEKAVLIAFDEFCEQLKEVSSALPFNDLKAFMRGTGVTGDEDTARKTDFFGFESEEDEEPDILDRALDGLLGVLESRLQDSSLMSLSEDLENSFLGAIEFMLAHEMAHLVLGHFPLSNDCQQAKEREAVADKYAVLLNALSSYDGLPKLNIKGTPSEWSLSGKSAIARWSHARSNFDNFFRYAYKLAEFDNFMSALPDCQYLSTDERADDARYFHWVLDETLKSAQLEDAWRRARWDLETGDIEAVLKETINEAEKGPDGISKDYILQYSSLLHDVYFTYYKTQKSPLKEQRTLIGAEQ